MEVHSKNEFQFGGTIEHSPRANKTEEPNMMKAIPLKNLDERRKSGKSPENQRSPDSRNNINQKRLLMS